MDASSTTMNFIPTFTSKMQHKRSVHNSKDMPSLYRQDTSMAASMTPLSVHLPTLSMSNDIQGILDIFEATEEILQDPVMEPVPLGPNGIQDLVREVPFSAFTGLFQTDNDEVVDTNALCDALNPLLGKDACCMIDPSTALSYQNMEGYSNQSFMSQSKPEPMSISSSLSYPPDIKTTRQASELAQSCNNMMSGAVTSDLIELESKTIGLFEDQEDDDKAKEDQRFRIYQADKWNDRYKDLIVYRMKHGHCLVPHNFPENQKLAQWIKRQRYQYKLKSMGRHSTLTDERQEMLENMGFVWDSHKAAWVERFEELKIFKASHGHCNVPANYTDRPLAIWVKCQRRQCKLYHSGDSRSTMTRERFALLERVGFDWNPRNL